MDMQQSQPHIWHAIEDAPVRSFLRVTDLPGNWWGEEARWALEEAVRKGVLLRVRKRLYYKGVHTRYGMTSPRIEEIVREVLGSEGVGPSGYTAARMLGLTTQIPAQYEVATTRTVSAIDGVVQHSRSNVRRRKLNAHEIAILELLRAPEIYVERGWDSLVAAVKQLAESEEVSMEHLMRAVAGEYNAMVPKNAARLSMSLQNSLRSHTILEQARGE